jgi:cyclic-di-AMP phosphodiesterase PgpH
MSTGGQKRKRTQRVTALELPPALFPRLLVQVRQGQVLGRIGICLLTATVLWALIDGMRPPFPWREGFVPSRNIVSRVDFTRPDPEGTRAARERARRHVRFVYDNDAEPLNQLQAALQNRLVEVREASSLDDLSAGAWAEFLPQDVPPPPADVQERQFQALREVLAAEGALKELENDLNEALASFKTKGLFKEFDQKPDEGNQREIEVVNRGQDGATRIPAAVSEVHIPLATPRLQRQLDMHVESRELARRVFNWLAPKLPTTLKRNDTLTKLAQEHAAAAVEEKMTSYDEGKSLLAKGGVPLNESDVQLLELEYATHVSTLSVTSLLYRSLAIFGMFGALYLLCGFYILYRESKLLDDLRQFIVVQAMTVATVGLSLIASSNEWRAELVPVLLFGMTIAIAYHQELALLLAAAVSLIVVVAVGHGLFEFVVLLSGVATTVLLLGRIRSRRKLIYVGVWAGGVAALTYLGVNILNEQPVDSRLFAGALWVGLLAVGAGFLMTGLLPFIENLFGVLTDISLLELGDVAHPLLQELVRRAPGTYNHSINVASIAEAAADSIGARGLLVRVGAYFHDIGKMLKPGYFVENQGQEVNRHESLMPAMSTLIIIAHIKDGADLARQHHVPQPIIDFIQQHHGTTLVEYFYRRANERLEADPNGGTVDESSFRYPGPKPQTKEAGVLMLADAVESASRVLAGPTPARIESLVHEIAMKRLLDGQFDDCKLTLQEVATIENSLVKSLTAVYHGRVKYPGQRTA